jgi:hypothetical protein
MNEGKSFMDSPVISIESEEFDGVSYYFNRTEEILLILLKNGGAEEDRTPDLGIANATLSQLSYGPKRWLLTIVII